MKFRLFLVIVISIFFVTPLEAAGRNTTELYSRALAHKQKGEWLKASQLYYEILDNYPDLEDVEVVSRELEEVNLKIITSNVSTPQTTIYQVKSGDTLGKIAKNFGTTVELIKKRNDLKSDAIKLGQKLSIWKAPFEIWVDKSSNILLFKSEGKVLKVYPVSTGKGNSSPVGEFIITSKLPHPTWYKKGKIVPPHDPENHLGTRWLGFNLPQYGIHGTVEPHLIGQQVSHGCVRMKNEDVEELFDFIPVGTPVKLID